MRMFVQSLPRELPPPEMAPALFDAFAAWREKYRDKMEVFEFFIGGGGFGIVNVDDEDELHQMILEFPLGLYSTTTTTPIVQGDKGLARVRARVQEMQQPMTGGS